MGVVHFGGLSRPRRPGLSEPLGLGGHGPPPDTDRSINPITTKGGGADYAHHITTCPPPPDCLTFLRPWGSGLANFSYFFSTNFNLVAKKKSSFSDCRTNSLSDDYYFYIYCPRLLLFLFSSVLFLPFFLAAARWEKGPLMGWNPFWMRIKSEADCFCEQNFETIYFHFDQKSWKRPKMKCK